MERKIVIIDDEPLIVAGLAEKVDWNSVGGVIVGTATNGDEGLRLIEEKMPDIVITDIVMPVCSGIRLAEVCRQMYPNINIILISAYSDFKYAQQAIRLKITDYVLKPVEPEKLLEIVRKTINFMQEQEKQMQHVSELEKNNLAIRQFVSTFLLFETAQKGKATDAMGMEEELDILLSKPGVVMFLCLYNIPKGETEKYYSIAEKIFLTSLEKQELSIFSRREENGTTILCQLPKRTEDMIKIEQAAQAAVKNTHLKLRSTGAEEAVCVCILSRPYKNALELKHAYRLCIDFRQTAMFVRKSSVLQAEKLNPEVMKDVELEEILHFLRNGNTEKMRKAIQQQIDEIIEKRDYETGVLFLKSLHRRALNVCALAGISHLPNDQAKYEWESFELTAVGLENWLAEVSNYISHSNDFVQKMELVIYEHYSDSGFGLAEAAEILGVSNSYLSRQFKKRTGENFVDKLLFLRMDKAKYLLETTQMNVAAVANAVGFTESGYFAQVFKKNVGVTPSQYREKCQMQDGK